MSRLYRVWRWRRRSVPSNIWNAQPWHRKAWRLYLMRRYVPYCALFCKWSQSADVSFYNIKCNLYARWYRDVLKCIVSSPVYQARIEYRTSYRHWNPSCTAYISINRLQTSASISAQTSVWCIFQQARRERKRERENGSERIWELLIRNTNFSSYALEESIKEISCCLHKQSSLSRLGSRNRAINCNLTGCSKRKECKRSQNNRTNAVQYIWEREREREYIINIIINNYIYIYMVKRSKYYYVIV